MACTKSIGGVGTGGREDGLVAIVVGTAVSVGGAGHVAAAAAVLLLVAMSLVRRAVLTMLVSASMTMSVLAFLALLLAMLGAGR